MSRIAFGEIQPDRLMTVDEVAERLRKTPAALRWQMQRGSAPPHAKLGGRVMFLESRVEKWIADAFETAS